MKFKRRVPPLAVAPIRILQGGLLQLEMRAGGAVLDGVRHKARCGCWMFYREGGLHPSVAP